MPRLLTRIIAVLLLPCFLSNDAAAAISRPPLPITQTHLFQAQALQTAGVWMHQRYVRGVAASVLLAVAIVACAGQQVNLSAPVPPFRTLPDAVKFVQEQSTLGAGLPASFRVPPSTVLDESMTQVVREGAGLYDTALAILVLVQSGKLHEARHLLDIYADGYGENGRPYGTMNLRAFPSYDGAAFAPLRPDLHLFFDFTRTSGLWDVSWNQWRTHVGPNAWLGLATAAYLQQAPASAQDAKYVNLMRHICDAILLLQDEGTQGGIRYAPQGVSHDPGTSDPYLEINSENNVSAYALLLGAAQLTGDQKYQQAADRVLQYFQSARIFNTATGQMQAGLMSPGTFTFVKGVVYRNGRWESQTEFAADSAGTWAISAFGPAQIDALWGQGAAYRMLMAVRQIVGRTSRFQAAGLDQELAGVDFSDVYPVEQALISPEWSAGYRNAALLLVDFYRGREVITQAQLAGLERDAQTINTFIDAHPEGSHYAIGPGMASPRSGETGHRWFSAPGPALASVFKVLRDPLAAVRTFRTSRLVANDRVKVGPIEPLNNFMVILAAAWFRRDKKKKSKTPPSTGLAPRTGTPLGGAIGQAQIEALRQVIVDYPDQNLLGVVLYLNNLQPRQAGTIRIKKTGTSFMFENPQDSNFDFFERMNELTWVDERPLMPLLLHADADQKPFQSFDAVLKLQFLPAALSGGAWMNAPKLDTGAFEGAWGVVARTPELEKELTELMNSRLEAISGQSGPLLRSYLFPALIAGGLTLMGLVGAPLKAMSDPAVAGRAALRSAA